MISRNCFSALFLSVCLGSSCVSGFGAGTKDQPASDPAATSKASSNTGSTDAVLGPNDEISMTVYQEEDLKTKAIIDKNGMVMLPLLGQVKLGGLSVGQAQTRIQELYDKDYLVNPQVNVIVETFGSKRFSVLGQVQRPGSFNFPQNESANLLEAIAMAGGYTRLAAHNKVTVRRIVNGSPKIFYLDADKMAKDSKNKPFEILPDDIINVGERIF